MDSNHTLTISMSKESYHLTLFYTLIIVVSVLTTFVIRSCSTGVERECKDLTLIKYENPNYLYQCEDNGILFSKPFLIYSAKNINKKALIHEITKQEHGTTN